MILFDDPVRGRHHSITLSFLALHARTIFLVFVCGGVWLNTTIP